MAIVLSSSAFQQGEKIPTVYTCDGKDLSPPLQWQGLPAETKSIAIICDDPDAPMGTWVHWVIFNLPGTLTSLEAGVLKVKSLENGAIQGWNDFGRIGYGGPCPPRGSTHRYFFKIYALDAILQLEPDIDKELLAQAMQGHILAEGHLMGKYHR